MNTMAIFTKKCLPPLYVMCIGLLLSTSTSAQFEIEKCNYLINSIYVDSCSKEFTITNKMIPIDGMSVDSFDLDIRIDLWGDGTQDLIYVSDTIGAPSWATYHPRIKSGDDLIITLPDPIYLSCNTHYVYWKFTDSAGNDYECDGGAITSFDVSLNSLDTIEFQHFGSQSNFMIDMLDLDFSSVDLTTPLDDCINPPSLYFEMGGNSIHPYSGLKDYNCETGRFEYYSKIIVQWFSPCSISEDSIILKIVDMEGGDFYPNRGGIMETAMGNHFQELNFDHSDCEAGFWNYSAYEAPCRMWQYYRNDDFNDGVDTFVIYKEDQTRLGLTCRDLMLMRQAVLAGNPMDFGLAFSGDFTNSGEISTLDLVLLQRTILMIDEYDFDQPWYFELDEINSPGFEKGDLFNEFICSQNFTTNDPLNDNFRFVGYKKGDLDGSYYNYATIFGDSCKHIIHQTIEVQLEDQLILEGEEFSFPVLLNQDLDLRGMHFGLSSDLVSNVTAQAGLIDIGDGSNSVDSNFIALWISENLESTNYQKGQVLFYLNFVAKKDFNLSELFAGESLEFPKEIYVNDGFEVLTFDFGDFGISGIKEHEILTGVNVFPNPFDEQLTIDFGDDKLHNVGVKIFDANGREIKEFYWAESQRGQKLSVNLDELLSGIYFLNIVSTQGHFVERIVRL